jgi:hypothetical protein
LLATAAYELGVSSPPGHPLHTLLGHALIRLLPVGEVIFRTALLSALASAAAVGVVYAIGARLFRRRWAAALGALLFAVSDGVWSSAVVTDVHALQILLMASALHFALRHARGGPPSDARWAAVMLGLATANHPMALLWAPSLAVSMLVRRTGASAREAGVSAILMAAPVLLYAYLPFASARDPFVNWGDVSGPGQALAHATGGELRAPIGARSAGAVWHNLVNYAGWPEEHVRDGHLMTQFGASLLWLAPIGLLSLLRRRRAEAWVALAAYGAPVGWALIMTRDPAGTAYMPSHLVVALWIGAGARAAVSSVHRRMRRFPMERRGRRRVVQLAQACALVLPVFVLAGNFRALDRSGDNTMAALGRAALERAGRDSIVIASGVDWAFPMVYMQRVRGVRPDVRLLLLPYFRDPNYRLIERERARGVVVREARCDHVGRARAHAPHAWCRVFQLVRDNHARRTVYIAGPLAEMLASSPESLQGLPPFGRVAGTVPMLEFRRALADGSRGDERTHRASPPPTVSRADHLHEDREHAR